jgi:DNA-binding CsgD family transcriptional regulator/PAS domain-containing protein
MDCIDDLILIVDTRLRIAEGNRGASVFFGYPIAALVAKSLTAFIDSDDRERISCLILGAKERRRGETVFLNRYEGKMRVRFSLSPLPGNGERLQGYLIIGRSADEGDILRKVEASNGLAVRMLKGFSDPLIIVDGPTRTVRDCNEAALDALGFARGDLVGHSLLSLTKGAEERQRLRSLEERAERTYATAGIFQERVLFPRKDAPALRCDLTGLPFFRTDGSLDSIIVMLFDRTAEEERKAELAQLIAQLGGLAAELAAMASEASAPTEARSLSELGFTSRQIEIARMASAGATSKEIGFRLGIAESTVKSHFAAMYGKLGVDSRIGFMRALSTKRIRIR